MSDKHSSKRVIANNKKAYHDYFVLETYEAGISLFGTEVKSIRAGAVNLKDSYCQIKDGEITILGMHISPYEKGNIFNRDPYRPKKLLMHKKEILKLFSAVGKQGLSVIPLSVYLKGSYVKMEIGLWKGKKLYDKRETDAKKQAERDIDRTQKSQKRNNFMGA